MTGIDIARTTATPPTAPRPQGLKPLGRRQATDPSPLRQPDRLEQGLVGAKAAASIGETTLRLLRENGLKAKPSSTPVNWVTLAGFADGAALSTEDPRLQTACMLAGHYGGYRFGLAAPLIGRTEGLIAVTGVTAAAILPQLVTQTLTDPLHAMPKVAPNPKARNRAAFVGGSVGAGLAVTTMLTHPNLLKPQAAIPLIAFGTASGALDGVAAVTNQRREQAISTGLGHVAGFAMTAMVPGMSTASCSGLTRAGLAAVSLAPFVVASTDASKHGSTN
jgi:hypothetical protein